MTDSISRYWNELIFSGTDKAPTEQIRRKVMLANQLSISLFVLGIPILILFLCWVQYGLYIYGTIVILSFCLLVIYWNKQGYHNFTRLFICIASTLAAGFFPLMGKLFLFGDQQAISMYYIPRYFLLSFIVAPLLLIDLSEKGKLVFCILFNAAFLLGFDILDNLFGVGFFQEGYFTEQYYAVNFYVLINFLFLLSGLIYLQVNNKKYEEDIQELNQTLDSRIRQQTQELQEANTDLKAFNYTVSHELKTPLTAAQMVSHTLIAEYQDQLDKKVKAHIMTIEDCMAEMQQLIKNIMTFSKLSGLEKKNEQLDMNRLTLEIIEELSSQLEVPENMKITKQQLPEVKGDKAMIKLALSNLLSNAIKYTREVENPQVEIGGFEKDDQTVYYIKDNGIGFDMKREKERLFKLYERLHSKTTYQGSGVGLAITQRIISRHGGKIWAESKPGKGATFYFSLPQKSL